MPRRVIKIVKIHQGNKVQENHLIQSWPLTRRFDITIPNNLKTIDSIKNQSLIRPYMIVVLMFGAYGLLCCQQCFSCFSDWLF
jgi:hypothetical protein